jgi:hypothetical protein
MYMCFRDINEVCIPGQKSERSCVCLLGISVKCVYQARRGGSHIYMFYGYQSSVYTRPGEGAVMYMCFRDINQVCILGQESERSCIYVLGISIVYTRPGEGTVMCMCFRDINQVCIPGQERGQSCICVLWISIKCVYQARRGGSHVYVF